jgi:release factor glutamine methyltransferase
MRKLLKRGISFFLVPAVRWYLRKPRTHHYRGTNVVVYPGVFHPGLFSSTHFLIDYLATCDISHKSVLELGCGTGLISIWVSGQGAIVTAVDLSRRAIENTQRNIDDAKITIRVRQSDLFDALAGEIFDWIIINPPYYARPVLNESDLAWNCGENLEYFHKLFATLHQHIHSGTEVIMILTQEGCDLPGVYHAAAKHAFYLEMIKERNALLDGKDFLFRIRRSHAARAEVQA